jgi:tRNA-binding protein
MSTPLQAFATLEMRAGRIVRAEPHPKARKASYQLWIDLGPELGVKQSSAQITENYLLEELPGRLVICATNLGTRNIAGFVSEVLTMGVNDAQGHVVLLQSERDVPLGSRVY